MATYCVTVNRDGSQTEPDADDKYHAAMLLAREIADAIERRTPNTSVAAAIYDYLTLDDHGPGRNGPLNCVCDEAGA